MLNSSSVNIGSQPDNNHSLTLLDAEPVPERSVPANPQNLLGNRSLRVKEERALIQRRTVEPAQPQAPPSPALNFAGVISARPAFGALLPQRLRNGIIVQSALEDNVPHRNDLPPREEMPYCPSGPTVAEMLEHQMSRRALASKPQPEPQQPLAPSERPSNVSQTTANVSQTTSDGNPQ